MVCGHDIDLGRRRKAWLINGDGRRFDHGRMLPGYCVCWNERPPHHNVIPRSHRLHQQRDAKQPTCSHNAKCDLDALKQVAPVSPPSPSTGVDRDGSFSGRSSGVTEGQEPAGRGDGATEHEARGREAHDLRK